MTGGKVIEFTVLGNPVANPRTRATSIGKSARVYNPTTIKRGGLTRPHPIVAYKQAIQIVGRRAHHGQPLTGPLRVHIVCVFARPKRLTWKRKPMPRVPHDVKPDRDNLDKAVLDALNKILWQDDCQICLGGVEKWYAAGDEAPHVHVRVEEF